jgi:hypothetical protein
LDVSEAATVSVDQNNVVELTLTANRRWDRPTAEIEFDCAFTDPTGTTRVVPGFWAGDRTWRVRYASGLVGRHEYVTSCSDEVDTGLENHRGTVEVTPYMGDNPLFRHGPVRLSDDGLRLSHTDGTPFFWLGDTWWFAPIGAFRWPDVVKTLTNDRLDKGYTVIQLVAGLFPEMQKGDPKAANEGGFAWTDGYEEINPAFFDHMDVKIKWLVESGLVPCIVGAWGYFLTMMGEPAMKRHWRNIIARYGAYPTVWCIAGEASLPYYEDMYGPDGTTILQTLHQGWQRLAKYVKAVDPYHRLTTVHPCPLFTLSSHDVFSDPNAYDIDMLQTGHTDRQSFDASLRAITEAVARQQKPVINGEVCYEGIMGSSWQDTQRLMFWSHMVGGAAGHTYGNLSIAVFSSRDEPNRGVTRCDDGVWEDTYDLPGSRQMGIGKRLLERFDWHRMRPHVEWVDPHWTTEQRILPFAAGIPRELRIFYFPSHAFLPPQDEVGCWSRMYANITLRDLEDDVAYRAFFFNPRTGEDLPPFPVRGVNGEYVLPGGVAANAVPTREDWVLVLHADQSSQA